MVYRLFVIGDEPTWYASATPKFGPNRHGISVDVELQGEASSNKGLAIQAAVFLET